MASVTPIDELLPLIAATVRRCPTTLLRRAYLDAARELCQQSQWLRMTVQGNLVSGVREYSLGNDDHVEVVNIGPVSGQQDPSNGIQFWPIVVSDPTMWDPNLLPGQPVRYAYIPEGNVAFDPVPSQAFGVTVSLIVQPRLGQTVIPTSLISKWDNELRSGALGYLCGIPGEPWTDPIKAEKYDREFSSGIANAKADAQRRYNTGAQRARPRAFIV